MQGILIPEFRLTQPVYLNNQAICMDYRIHLVASATKKTDLNFSHVLL